MNFRLGRRSAPISQALVNSTCASRITRSSSDLISLIRGDRFRSRRSPPSGSGASSMTPTLPRTGGAARLLVVRLFDEARRAVVVAMRRVLANAHGVDNGLFLAGGP